MKNIITAFLVLATISSGKIRAEVLGDFLRKDIYQIAVKKLGAKTGGLPFLSSGPLVFQDDRGTPYNYGDTKLIVQYLISEKIIEASQLFQGLFSSREAVRCASSIGLEELYGLPDDSNGFQYREVALSKSNWTIVEFWRKRWLDINHK